MMQCNIDATGQMVRRIWGALCLTGAAGCAAGAYFGAIWWLYLLAGGLVIGGLFAFWEAQKKWCIVRAMGIKTKY